MCICYWRCSKKIWRKKTNFMSIYIIFFKTLIDIIVYFWKLHWKIRIHLCGSAAIAVKFYLWSGPLTIDQWVIFYSCTSAVRRPSTSKGNIGLIDWLIDWLIDLLLIYAISPILQPCNGRRLHRTRFTYLNKMKCSFIFVHKISMRWVNYYTIGNRQFNI